MADINKIGVGIKVQLITKDGVCWAYTIAKTKERVWLYIFDGTGYLRDEQGEPIKKLVSPKKIRIMK